MEVLSPSTRQLDLVTRRADYARAGVHEYWLVDPDAGTMTFLRLRSDPFEEVPPQGDAFASLAVSGFVLDLSHVRRAFGIRWNSSRIPINGRIKFFTNRRSLFVVFAA